MADASTPRNVSGATADDSARLENEGIHMSAASSGAAPESIDPDEQARRQATHSRKKKKKSKEDRMKEREERASLRSNSYSSTGGSSDLDAISLPTQKKTVTQLSIEEFLEELHGPPGSGVPSEDLNRIKPKVLAFDVRSPAEYEKGHVPGVRSLPMFSNEERAIVGTTYKKSGKFAAIRAGLQIIGPKMGSVIDTVRKIGAVPGARILIHCWRGGMRSGSIGWLLSLCGYDVSTLKGGYRSYRRWCKTIVGNDRVQAPSPIVVLGGCTGVGKTAILHRIKSQGEQIMDLEGLANHRGSAFGAMGMDPQPSNEAYENALAFIARQADPKRPLWLEHESGHVGTCLVPDGVRRWVQEAPKGVFLTVEMSQELRVQRLVEDYCSQESLQIDGWTDQLKECIAAKRGGLAKKLGGMRVKQALAAIDCGDWHLVAQMMLGYYDTLYTQWQEMSTCEVKAKVHCPTNETEFNANLVLATCKDQLSKMRLESESIPSWICPYCGNHPISEAPTEVESPSSLKVVGPEFKGTCHCGEVTITATDSPLSVSYCHCTICRRLTGSPFSCQALFPASKIAISYQPGGQLIATQTSKSVYRKRCATCYSPIVADIFGGKICAVPLELISRRWGVSTKDEQLVDEDTAHDLRPQHHLYYASRVMDVVDGLPKYATSKNLTGKRSHEIAPTIPETGSTHR